jgi:hypothetical protein
MDPMESIPMNSKLGWTGFRRLRLKTKQERTLYYSSLLGHSVSRKTSPLISLIDLADPQHAASCFFTRGLHSSLVLLRPSILAQV